MNRDDAKVFLHAGIFALCLVLAAATYAAADPPKLPAGVTCVDVRAKVAEYGKVYAYAWAKLQGFTAAEINEARKCLK